MTIDNKKLRGLRSSDNVLLKLNRYKRVELLRSPSHLPFIRKRYSGHSEEDLKKNTRHDYHALAFLKQSFSDVIHTPTVLSWDPEKHEVTMEFLPELASADPIGFHNINATRPFFDRCYSVDNGGEFLDSMRDSVLASPSIVRLIDCGFPLALGFKGDFRDNAGILNGKPIIADIETMCLEPMGLTELVVYGQCFASWKIYPTLKAIICRVPVPIAWQDMTHEQAQAVTSASLELLSLKMAHLPNAIRKLKVFAARWGLSYLLARQFVVSQPTNR